MIFKIVLATLILVMMLITYILARINGIQRRSIDGQNEIIELRKEENESMKRALSSANDLVQVNMNYITELESALGMKSSKKMIDGDI